MRIPFVIVTALVAVAPLARAQAPIPGTTTPLRVDMPLVDAPYNVSNGGRAPSMAQSLAAGTAFQELTHEGIKRAWGKHTTLAGTTIWLFDLFAAELPLGDAWVHEEYHRAVMGNRGIGSFDDVYLMKLTSEVVAVSHVRDEDLVRLKREHPAEQVRLGAAGMEGEQLLVQSLEQDRFFHGSTAYMLPFYWFVKLGTQGYVAGCTTAEADRLTNDMNVQDGANVKVRDFTGLDFSGWVYDLFRSDEPYTARGIHPSGVGINRYIKASDLSAGELSYLKRQGNLQLFNFLDPNLLGISGVTVRNPLTDAPVRLNASMAHYLTSFGHTVDLNTFVRSNDLSMFVVLHRYVYAGGALPGIDATVIDHPVKIGGRQFDVSPRAALWLQPEAQRFHAERGRLGGLLGARVRVASSQWVNAFAEVDAKSEGWVAGDVRLDPAVEVRVGASFRLK